MAQAARVGDVAVGADGAPAIEAKGGSPDVFINGLAALRADDAASEDASGAAWQATGGSRGILINGMPAMRAGDATASRQRRRAGRGRQPRRDARRPRRRHAERASARSRGHDRVHRRARASDRRSGRRRLLPAPAVGANDGRRQDHRVGPLQRLDGECPQGPRRRDLGRERSSSLDGAVASRHRRSPDGRRRRRRAAAPIPRARSSTRRRPPGTSTRAAVGAPRSTERRHHRGQIHHRPQLGRARLPKPSVTRCRPGSSTSRSSVSARRASARRPARRPIATRIEKEAGWGDVNEVELHPRAQGAGVQRSPLLRVHRQARQDEADRRGLRVHDRREPEQGPAPLAVLARGGALPLQAGPLAHEALPGARHRAPRLPGQAQPKPSGNATAEAVIALAHSQIGTLEHGYNRQKYGEWYGDNGVFWCAEFVSWVHGRTAGCPRFATRTCRRLGRVPVRRLGHVALEPRQPRRADGDGRARRRRVLTSGSRASPADAHRHRREGSRLRDLRPSRATPSPRTARTRNGGGVHPRSRARRTPPSSASAGLATRTPTRPGDLGTSAGAARAGRSESKYSRDQTLLHHHYFAEKHGHEKPDPKAARYRRFMHLYREAKNAKLIPYLIVSSHYVKSYAEWVCVGRREPREGAAPVVDPAARGPRRAQGEAAPLRPVVHVTGLRGGRAPARAPHA